MNEEQLTSLIEELTKDGISTTVNEVVLTALTRHVCEDPEMDLEWTATMYMEVVHAALLSIDRDRGVCFVPCSPLLQMRWRDEDLIDADNPRHPLHKEWRQFNHQPFTLMEES